ncbi:unnamed protein product [Brachionus calyciflorus]|uniref:G-protein coupled receptors family 1 profile domain-containing protein n=1 Tax=Brachionus calyciflorus TaxID=104777 RepID=A0A814ABJ5_9BILA|nr:unnamed protein product [Brachionus calyciflorus]
MNNSTNGIQILEDYKYIEWAIRTTQSILFFVSVIIFPIGIIFNTLEIIIFRKPKFQKTTMGFYFTINSSLNLFIIFYLLIFIPPSIKGHYLHLKSDLTCKFYYFFLRVLYQSSSWLNVFITADRLVFVLYPNRFKFQKDKLKLSIFLFVFLLLISTVSLPNLFMKRTVIESIYLNKSLLSIYCTANPSVLLIRDIELITMRTCLPFILMFLLNLMLIYKVFKSKLKFNRISRNLNLEFKFAFTVITTTFIFLIIFSPNVVYIVLSNIYNNNRLFVKQIQTKNAFLVLFETCSSLSYFSMYSFNFLIQMAFNTIFLEEVSKIFLKKLELFKF